MINNLNQMILDNEFSQQRKPPNVGMVDPTIDPAILENFVKHDRARIMVATSSSSSVNNLPADSKIVNRSTALFLSSNDGNFGVGGNLSFQFLVADCGGLKNLINSVMSPVHTRTIMDRILGKIPVIRELDADEDLGYVPYDGMDGYAEPCKLSEYTCPDDKFKVWDHLARDLFWAAVYDIRLNRWALRIVPHWKSQDLASIAIPMVRRVFPALIASNMIGVQPMSAPVGMAFAMKTVYGGTHTTGADAELPPKNLLEITFNEVNIAAYYAFPDRIAAYMAALTLGV